MVERIAKRLARCGLCSRREAERWVRDGRVEVDGKVLVTPAVSVTLENKIVVDGRPLPEEPPAECWRYHKPRGVLTTSKDPMGRSTIFDKLPETLPRVITVGRLDFNTEGLLLLTNDGDLARYLELPSTGWTRRYRVRVHGKIDQPALDSIAKGIRIGGINYLPLRAKLDRVKGDNAWLTLYLSEGKNREVRYLMEYLGLKVTRLIRTAYGPFVLGELARGHVEKIDGSTLMRRLGNHSTNIRAVNRGVDANSRRKI